MTKTITKRETRFAVHLPKTDYREDAHYIKEQVHYSDGTSLARTFMVKDAERPIWVTTVANRTHKEKREFEEVEKLQVRKCTQSNINKTVAGMLDAPHIANRPDSVKSSPYVYGYDQTSTSLIKLKSLERNNFIQTPYTLAVFDIETDIETREILIATVVYGDRAHVTVTKKYLAGRIDVANKVNTAMGKYLPQYAGKLDIKLTIHDDEVSMLKAVFATANAWAPDFVAAWNINFDLPRVQERLREAGVNPVDVICDQTIPRQYRYFNYKEGMTKKVMASGKAMPIPPSLQWHKITSTTTFHFIDAMCVYRQLRMAKQSELSYSLDAILQKVLGSRKLSFEEASGYTDAKWHTFMQVNYPIEYIVYNIYDCLGVLELDKVTKDLSQSLPSGAGMTDFNRFNSNPKKIVDALFIFGLERGKVVGTVPKIEREEETVEVEVIEEEMVEDEDSLEEEEDSTDVKNYKNLDLKGWIQLLPQNLLLAEGLKCLEDFPDVVTNLRGVVWDVDATAAYPNCTLVGNVSKETCYNELISIEGVDEATFREQNLSMCLGGVNSLEYFSEMFSLPMIDTPEMDALIYAED